MRTAKRLFSINVSIVRAHLSISLDGYGAGPNQSLDNPIGEGGMRLHEWVFPTAAWRGQQGLEGGEDSVDSGVAEEVARGVGAYIMGRHMFGGGTGAWDESWTGWWGETPPYHVPVFVLTHHARTPLTMSGGTTFTFVTGGLEEALEQARAAAAEQDVMVAGGVATVRQCLAAGRLDELYLHLVPILLGRGERLFEAAGDPVLEPASVVASPGVTHIRYRVSSRS
jgi:dihydrofolate reductase